MFCFVERGGGDLADKYIGYKKSLTFGGVLMAIGMFAMLVNNDLLSYIGIEISRSSELLFFYASLATIIVGNGFFKPNISTISFRWRFLLRILR